MKSMTGFGQGVRTPENSPCGFRVEISSINRKQFELKFVLPRELGFYESKLRALVSEKITRGSLILRVEQISTEQVQEDLMPARINRAFAKAVYSEAQKLRAELGLNEELTLSSLLAVPGVIENSMIDYAKPEIEKSLIHAVGDALNALLESKSKEGAQLQKDLAGRLAILQDCLAKIEPLVKTIPILQKEKLLQKLREANLELNVNDDRILRELVIFADKADVTEEITRLHSHFKHFSEALTNPDQVLGRTLDFMVQEIFREINTLGNKAASVEVSPLIVVMKTELEKIREQVQNIE